MPIKTGKSGKLKVESGLRGYFQLFTFNFLLFTVEYLQMLNKKIYIYCLLIACFVGMRGDPVSWAATAEERYYEAAECYQELLKTPEKLKYRENWFPCIEKFRDAYRGDPSGRYAAANLYMAGKLYQGLYNRSFKVSDKKAALDYFQRVLKHFPKSSYRPKAEEGIQNFSRQPTGKARVQKKGTFPKVRDLKNKVKVREEIYKKSKAEYKASRIKRPKVKHKSSLGKNSEKTYAKPYKKKFSSSADSDTTVVTELRFWSNPSYTRVVIDADKETSYTHRLLKKDPSAHKPHRLYIDFDNSRLGNNIEKDFPINDNLLTRARAGLQSSGSVRVVIDIKSFKTYKVFSLRNPFRTVIDVWGGNASSRQNGKWAAKKDTKRKEPREKDTKKEKRLGKEPENKIPNLTQSLALGVRRIVIDPGHGGHDPGAVGYYKKVYEKDIVLSIAKKLARKIRQRLGCEVIMTRNSDRFLSLEERTAIANTKNADLFISIHTNAHKDRRAYGIETYFLNLATDDDAVRVAARENATTRKNISDLQKILNDLMQNAKINESTRLAVHIQKHLCGYMKQRKYSRIKNKGVKQAPFYVLLGAQMPSVLIETSFISNKRECKRLRDAAYQDDLCEGILRGIRKYINEINPTALRRLHHRENG